MKKSGFTLIELLVVIAIVGILFSLFSGCGMNGVNSNGDRAGVITKFSYKEGIIAKSWEGELVLGGIRSTSDGGVGANIWAFTVPEDKPDLVEKAKYANANGMRVVVHYHQPFFYSIWESRSGYFVTDIHVAPTNTENDTSNPFL